MQILLFGGSGSAGKRLLLRDSALYSAQPLSWRGGRGGCHPRFGLGSCRGGCSLLCTGRAGGPPGACPTGQPPSQTPSASPVHTRLAEICSSVLPPPLSQLATVAETAMAITRINSVFVGLIAPTPLVTQTTDSTARALSPAPFFSLPPFPSSVSWAHASCSVSHGISQLQLPGEY